MSNLSRRDDRTIHLLKVLHKKAGDTFEAGILRGPRGTGRIEKINFDGSIFVTFQEHEREKYLQRLNLRMAVAFVRPIQTRRLLRDLSNMGVSSIDIVGTDLGEKSYRNTKFFVNGGSEAALIEGAVQARDTQIPILTIYENLDKWLEERPWDKTRDLQTLFNTVKMPLLFAMDNVRAESSFFNISLSTSPMVLAVGPERGWSDRERDLLERKGFLRLSMGERPLRTETACVAAAALAMEKIKEL
ncbi:MAG: RsmE family RNA methyltransferase [Treponema sp.]|nr:RsmE family RNA methyltransferase [Treponema sp.]